MVIHGLKNEIRNLIYFHVNSRRSESFHAAGLLLSKTYKDLDQKVKRVMSYDTDE